MKVLYTGTFDINAGGPAMSTYYTLIGLSRKGINSELLMYPLSKNGKLIGKDIKVYYAKPPIDHKLLYSFSYKRRMLSLGDYDIYHAQGVWQYPTYALADIARKKKRPYVITPRGMLYPQDIQKSNKLLKKLSLIIKLLHDLNNAACIHVTCEQEMIYCRQLGITSPIAIIPNPIDIKEYHKPKKTNTFRLGYLGRLSPRKNVESLLYAWKTLNTKIEKAELLIIGGGDIEYEKLLKRLVCELNLRNVYFTGFLFGKEKEDVLNSISVLAMPSEFENLGNVILEGLIRQIPCIATKGSPWKELQTYQCGWWIDYDQQSITNAIEEAINTPTEELKQKGIRGQNLIKENYSVESIANKMYLLYEWILKEREQPDFVYKE